MKKVIFLAILVIACKSKTETNPFTDFEIGIIADCQYCNCETQGNRFYKQSIGKFKSAVEKLNTKELDYTIHLGDFIDRNFESFDSVLPIWNSLKSEKYHVLGNHDFSVSDSLKPLVPTTMGLKNRYYSFIKNNWRFIVLDGNDLSYYGVIANSKKKETDSLFKLLKNEDEPNLKTWNGGLSLDQLQWVKEELNQAKNKNEYVGFYCHFPAGRNGDAHNLWNYKQFLQLIDSYDNVKFYFNGHNHNGDYLEKNSVHHLTFKGMLDTKNTSAFATAKFTKDSIFIKGYGREITRALKIN
ncbi:metallophosphoesterase [Gelatiniphilus marinus]|uniref:Metallophosphoesterase n=1 Tax=Gelatiniphilus marinus TaxID=1759464 RepID=A0ABW5JVP6_9FLAO